MVPTFKLFPFCPCFLFHLRLPAQNFRQNERVVWDFLDLAILKLNARKRHLMFMRTSDDVFF